MAITCKWNYKIGTCEENTSHGDIVLDIYGNGNCLFVVCDKNKNPYWFAQDKKHLEIMLGLKKDWTGKKNNSIAVEFKNFSINIACKEWKSIAESLVKANMDVLLYYNKKEAIND